MSRTPRVGDIWRDMFGHCEVVEILPGGALKVRYADEATSTTEGTYPSDYFKNDTLVSYMPDPNDPQPGDRFFYNDGEYRVDGSGMHGARSMNVTYLTGPEAGESFCWTIGKPDTPVRTLVQPEPVNTCAPAPFRPAWDDRVTAPNWEPEKYVKVEWVGDDQFAGQIFFTNTNGMTRPPGPRKTFNLDGESKWRIWTVPKPVPVEPPKPEVKKWEVTTETRPPRQADAYVDLKASSLVMKATFDHDTPSPVVTAVKPLEPSRIKTVWRIPNPGDQYLFGERTILRCSTPHHNEPKCVLVVE